MFYEYDSLAFSYLSFCKFSYVICKGRLFISFTLIFPYMDITAFWAPTHVKPVYTIETDNVFNMVFNTEIQNSTYIICLVKKIGRE